MTTVPVDESFLDESVEAAFMEHSMDSSFAEPLSTEDYENQKKLYTEAAVASLMASPMYQRKVNSCKSCWSCWLDDNMCSSCLECGGYGLTRPCPICEGRCGRIWQRDVFMSHSQHEAHWNGECGLTPEQQLPFLHKALTDQEPDDEALLNAMEDLSANEKPENDDVMEISNWQ